MSIKTLNPYLNFNGNAEQAIKLYEKALGAKTEALLHTNDAAKMGAGCAVGPESRVMHARLRIGGGVVMMSDCMPDQPVPPEHNGQISLDFDSDAELARAFDALAEGGQVIAAPHDAFWGARWGMLTDRFGVRWMFNCDKRNV